MSPSRVAPRPAAKPVPAARHPSPVIAIGASAGGIRALEALLSALPATTGAAYVVHLHQSPHHASALPQLLARKAAMKVVAAGDTTSLEPNQVHVVPPGAELHHAGGKLSLVRHAAVAPRRSIDATFTAIAEAYGDCVIGVLLSGAGSDGSLGLKAIKEHGGVTLAQEDAEHPDMPRSAVASGLVDYFLPMDLLVTQLVDQIAYVRKLDRTPLREGLGLGARGLGEILSILRNSTGHDFQNYKPSTMARRIQRRMQVRHVPRVEDYLSLLRSDGSEPDALLRDVLIGVTHFFRDKSAFDALRERVAPEILRSCAPGSAVRIWVPGCATGEEPYSLAIVFCEAIDRLGLDLDVQVFATDIDEAALQAARRGLYPRQIEDDVPPAVLERFFALEGECYQVAKRIRDTVVFSAHNVIKDPPFSRLDLISCRNLLIYLGSPLQVQVLPVFHYALKPCGYLFLGSAEGVGSSGALFQTIDKKHRLFKRRDVPNQALGAFGLFAPRAREAHRPVLQRAPKTADDKSIARVVERALLDAYAPTSVVINDTYEVLYIFGRTGKYLEPPEGSPTHNLLRLARPGLRSELRTAVRKAASGRKRVRRDGLRIESSGGTEVVRLTVEPVPGLGEGSDLLLVTLESDETPADAAAADLPRLKPSAQRDRLVRELETELKDAQERLQTIIEELEGSNEELKSSNEELLSMNEELQSSNEEIETTKEELQSVNEELATVNAELKRKVEEVTELNSDTQNLFESTQIATLFLDRELNIRNFTPAIADVFHIMESDRGRPIAHISQRFEYDGLQDAVQDVLCTLRSKEELVRTQGGGWAIMRILPYRTIEDVIDGVVITFMDVTQTKRAESEVHALSAALQKRLLELRVLLEVLPIGIALTDGDKGEVRVNRAAAELLGAELGSDSSEPLPYLLQSADAKKIPELERALHTELAVRDLEMQLKQGGNETFLLVNCAPLRDSSHRVYGSVCSLTNVTERKIAAQRVVTRGKQQEVIARLGLAALAAADAGDILREGLTLISGALGADVCSITQLGPDKKTVQVVAQTGSSSPSGGPIPLEATSLEKYLLDTKEVVVIDDIRSEHRFEIKPLLSYEGVVGGAAALIHGALGEPWGFLAIYFRSPHKVEPEDRNFIVSASHVLTLAFQRMSAERSRRDKDALDIQQRSDDQLRRAERMAALGTFAAGLGHELNNPLSTISMSADYAQRTKDSRQIEKMLANISEHAKRCSRIVEGVMRFARDETTKKWPNNLNAVAASAADLARSYLPSGKLDLVLDLARDLPPVRCNPTQIEQVIVNLLRNAAEAGPGTVNVRLSTERAGRNAKLSVEDNGPGIPADHLEKVFDPFHSTRRNKGGTGLGLSIAHRVVTDHGGTIRAFNRAAGGATFVVELPAAKQDDEQDERETGHGENPDRR